MSRINKEAVNGIGVGAYVYGLSNEELAEHYNVFKNLYLTTPDDWICSMYYEIEARILMRNGRGRADGLQNVLRNFKNK